MTSTETRNIESRIAEARDAYYVAGMDVEEAQEIFDALPVADKAKDWTPELADLKDATLRQNEAQVELAKLIIEHKGL